MYAVHIERTKCPHNKRTRHVLTYQTTKCACTSGSQLRAYMSSAQSVRAHFEHMDCARAYQANEVWACTPNGLSTRAQQAHKVCWHVKHTKSAFAQQAHKACACTTRGRSVRVRIKQTKHAPAQQIHEVWVWISNARGARCTPSAQRVRLHIKRAKCAGTRTMRVNIACAKRALHIGRMYSARAHQVHSRSRAYQAHTGHECTSSARRARMDSGARKACSHIKRIQSVCVYESYTQSAR